MSILIPRSARFPLHSSGDLYVYDQATTVLKPGGDDSETHVCHQLPRGPTEWIDPPLVIMDHTRKTLGKSTLHHLESNLETFVYMYILYSTRYVIQ